MLAPGRRREETREQEMQGKLAGLPFFGRREVRGEVSPAAGRRREEMQGKPVIPG